MGSQPTMSVPLRERSFLPGTSRRKSASKRTTKSLADGDEVETARQDLEVVEQGVHQQVQPCAHAELVDQARDGFFGAADLQQFDHNPKRADRSHVAEQQFVRSEEAEIIGILSAVGGHGGGEAGQDRHDLEQFLKRLEA